MELTNEHKRALIYYEYLDTKEPREIHQRLTTRLGDASTGFSTVSKWVRDFNCGIKAIKVTQSHGPEPTVFTPENAERVKSVIIDDPWITYHELEDKTGIPTTCLYRICTYILGLQKKLCRFVPYFLSDEQKQHRMNICRQNLQMIDEGGQKLVDTIITGDEVYVHYYEPKLSREAKIFVFENEVPPDVVRKTKTIGKVLYAVFFNTAGLIQAVKLEGQKTCTALWYTTKCLPRVLSSVGTSDVMIHHDNSRIHTASLTTQFLTEKNVKMVPHPPYSPDLAMCDFWLFSGLKHNLRGKSFKSEEEIDEAVLGYFDNISNEA